jgi:hypothetical protein
MWSHMVYIYGSGQRYNRETFLIILNAWHFNRQRCNGRVGLYPLVGVVSRQISFLSLTYGGEIMRDPAPVCACGVGFLDRMSPLAAF